MPSVLVTSAVKANLGGVLIFFIREIETWGVQSSNFIWGIIIKEESVRGKTINPPHIRKCASSSPTEYPFKYHVRSVVSYIGSGLSTSGLFCVPQRQWPWWFPSTWRSHNDKELSSPDRAMTSGVNLKSGVGGFAACLRKTSPLTLPHCLPSTRMYSVSFCYGWVCIVWGRCIVQWIPVFLFSHLSPEIGTVPHGAWSSPRSMVD